VTELSPFETLYDHPHGHDIPLPTPLDQIYGRFSLPKVVDRTYVISNFVTTLDGVVSLNAPGQSGGSEISGNNQHDRLLMGILRAVADSVVVGAGTLRAVPRHVWTSEHIYPALVPAYRQLRHWLGKAEAPLNVIVSGSGEVDLRLPVFQTPKIATLIVTTKRGDHLLHRHEIPPSVGIVSDGAENAVTPTAVLKAIEKAIGRGVVLIEGGPHLLGDFLADRVLDELFLTLAPQIAGRDHTVERPGLVSGHCFAPGDPRWLKLTDVRRANDHLFLRYQI